MAKRTPIPANVQAQVQFEADRTCCVCRTPGKPIQIHHIDEVSTNHSLKNLAVLCRDCHDLTMIRGTFNRRLNADVVTLYRDDWIAIVAEQRARTHKTSEAQHVEVSRDFANVVEKLEILRNRKEYSFLAIEYDRLGNSTLRDKYIDMSLKADPSDFNVMFLRSLQNKPERIPEETVARIIDRQTNLEDWSQLARTYYDIGDAKNAILNYCKSIINSIEKGNLFSAGYYLKELGSKELHAHVFHETYEKYQEEKNLWWAFRSLQELEWWSETREFLLRNEKKIEQQQDSLLLKELYSAKGDFEKFRELDLNEAKTIFSDNSSGSVGFKRPRKRKKQQP